MREITFFLSFLFVIFGCRATPQHTLLLYNVENFFDTIRNPSIDDRAFTPRGSHRWNDERYRTKISHIGEVFKGVAEESGTYPSIIALCEVENRAVVEDLISSTTLARQSYSILHSDSRDERGIDVAILYNDSFKIDGASVVTPRLECDPKYRGRDLLTMWGELEGEELFVVAAHLPSRLGGASKSAPLRGEICGQIVSIVDSVAQVKPHAKIVIMGDLNDNPVDRSVATSLSAKSYAKELSDGDLFALCAPLYMAGYGTSAYRGEWNLFDNIVVSANLVDGYGLRLRRLGYESRYFAQIYKPSYLIQQTGSFRGYPFRTSVGRRYLGGYSDHLPVYVVLESTSPFGRPQ